MKFTQNSNLKSNLLSIQQRKKKAVNKKDGDGNDKKLRKKCEHKIPFERV